MKLLVILIGSFTTHNIMKCLLLVKSFPQNLVFICLYQSPEKVKLYLHLHFPLLDAHGGWFPLTFLALTRVFSWNVILFLIRILFVPYLCHICFFCLPSILVSWFCVKLKRPLLPTAFLYLIIKGPKYETPFDLGALTK